MTLLIRTPAPFPTESLFGFVLRVAEANGYDSPRVVMQVAGLDRGWSQQPMPGLPVAPLARALGRGEAELHAIAYRCPRVDEWTFQVLGHALGGQPGDYLSYRRPAVCPMCVRETGFISAFWDLRIANVCPVHGVGPIRLCSSCGSHISWMREGLLRCHCGEEFDSTSEEVLPPQDVELMRLVEAKLVRKSIEGAKSMGFPVEWADRISFRAFAHAIDLLEASARSVNPELDPDQRVSAAAALADWPNGYHRLLRAVGNQSLKVTPDASGLCKQFEQFYGPFFRNTPLGREYDFLRQEFIRFGQVEWGRGAILPKLLNGETKSEARFESKSAFSRRHGLNNATLNRMIRDGDVVAVTTKEGRGGRTIIDVDASKVPEHVRSDEVTITVREAARLIGLPVAVIRVLRRNGVLKTPLRAGRGGTWYRVDVEAFLSNAQSLAAGMTRAADGLCLSDLMRLKFRTADAKAKVVAEVIEGRVPLIGAVGTTVGGLQVSRASIEPVVLQTRIVSLGGTQSLPQAAASCGISPDVIADALAKGLLAVTQISGYDRVTNASITEFRAKFVPLIRLADDLNTTARPLGRICDELGIPVQRLERSSGRTAQRLIHVEDATRVMLEFQNQARATELRSFDGRMKDQVRRVESYLAGLDKASAPLPRHNGGLNKSLIARECGVDRSVLDDNKKCAALLRSRDEAERANGLAGQRPRGCLEDYLAALRSKGSGLPVWNGRPNRLQIAKTCGFDRSAFDSDPMLCQLLTDFMKSESVDRAAHPAS